MAMLHECRATHVYGSLGTQNSMVTFIFKFDIRKSHFQVKIDQISKFKNSLQKHTYLVLQGGSLLQKFYFSDIFGNKIFS